MLVWIWHQIFYLSTDKDHLAYATSKLNDGGCGPDKWHIVESVGGFYSLVKFAYPAFLLDTVWAFTLSWSTEYRRFQTPASTWSSRFKLSKPGVWWSLGRDGWRGSGGEPVCVEERDMSTKCWGIKQEVRCSLYMIYNEFILEYDIGRFDRNSTNVRRIILNCSYREALLHCTSQFWLGHWCNNGSTCGCTLVTVSAQAPKEQFRFLMTLYTIGANLDFWATLQVTSVDMVWVLPSHFTTNCRLATVLAIVNLNSIHFFCVYVCVQALSGRI